MKQVVKIFSILLSLPILYCKSACFVAAKKIDHFSKKHSYALLVSNGFLLPLLILLWRVCVVYLEKKPFFMDSLVCFFVFCVLPPILLFLCIYKKPKMFFYNLFSKTRGLGKGFALFGRIEYFHCKKLSTGMFFLKHLFVPTVL